MSTSPTHSRSSSQGSSSSVASGSTPRWQETARNAAFYIAMSGLVFGGFGYINMGWGSLHSVSMSGWGIAHYFAGYHLVVIGAGLAISSVVLAVAVCYHRERQGLSSQSGAKTSL